MEAKENNYQTGREFARYLDKNDPLSAFRDQFHIPEKAGKPTLYFCGNSLGLQPKRVSQRVNQELDTWKNKGVEGHFDGAHPWVTYHHLGKSAIARLTGGRPHEVVAM
ncbi:MAG: kynureninase, partial [Cyclobacteriaceae bacterium]|nr:kynureninase [Cyclobacteriaceae bacterium]